MSGALQRQLQKYASLAMDSELFATWWTWESIMFDEMPTPRPRRMHRLVAVQAQLARGQLGKPSVPASSPWRPRRRWRASARCAPPSRPRAPNPSETESFDEIAGNIQKACNTYQHNVSMEVQAAL